MKQPSNTETVGHTPEEWIVGDEIGWVNYVPVGPSPDRVGVYCYGPRRHEFARLIESAPTLKADNERLRVVVRWFANELLTGQINCRPDHACIECCPDGDLVLDGFQCAPHAALALFNEEGYDLAKSEAESDATDERNARTDAMYDEMWRDEQEGGGDV